MGWGTRRKPGRLAEKLLQIRLALGLSQDSIIDHLGFSDQIVRSKISQFERGDREPDLLLLLAYARAAGISTDVLIDDNLDLPERLPTSRRILSGKSQRERIEARMETTTLTLWLNIESKDKSTSAEKRVRKNVEKSHLKKYKMKSVSDLEYELVFSYKDDGDLDEQVYALLNKIANEVDRHDCSMKVRVREKGTGRYW